MRTINQLFEHKGIFDHPTEAVWEPLLGNERTVCRVDWNPKELVRFDPKISLVDANTGVLLEESEDWDFRLNSFLLNRGVRAESPENEALRCSLTLRDELEVVEDTFGDGFYNKALISYISESEFGADGGIQKILVSLAPRLGGSFDLEKAKSDIDSSISEVASSLTVKLKYSLDEAVRVLTDGVRFYLDVRFSFSTRQLLGWT
jgi:hypothetical protein